jgi:predicted chitinase
MAVTAGVMETTEVTTEDRISIFLAVVMTEGAMYRLIVIADRKVVGRLTLVVGAVAAMAAAEAIGNELHNSIDKNRPD